jgi:3-oxoacyl-[acyl-carrier protein] reductase
LLSEKFILITGSNGGICSSVAELLLENNANLVLLYNENRQNIDKLLSKYKNSKKKIIVKQVDLTDTKKTDEVMKKILKTTTIDIFIHGPTFEITPKNIMKIEWSEFQKNIELQTKVFLQIVKVITPSMKEKGVGKIISILSSSVIGKPPSMMSSYVVGKYALLGVSKCLAVELGKFGVSVNSISPSMTKTSLTEKFPSKYMEIAASQVPLKGKIAEPNEIASVIFFLCSKYSDYMSGENLIVSGSQIMH